MTNMDKLAANGSRPGRKQKRHRPIQNNQPVGPSGDQLSMLDGLLVEPAAPTVKYDPLLDYFTP